MSKTTPLLRLLRRPPPLPPGTAPAAAGSGEEEECVMYAQDRRFAGKPNNNMMPRIFYSTIVNNQIEFFLFLLEFVNDDRPTTTVFGERNIIQVHTYGE